MIYLVSNMDDVDAERQAKAICPSSRKIKIHQKNGIMINGQYIGYKDLDSAYEDGYRYAYTLL